ncbi:hypothetical protein SARC_08390 [Sphaeroforma arctica JP610]|uniref:M23ase beta-sheet core domain-containing protein n=1 Tax=Sphaeroforma arctica JP610 TaxID=667725 RepID=A0A0L0FTA5_9EUKA|nr:hypothetical protein SARC_08390 [Sphaeroforma arctica JP610]KNC79203.1 hypothetical protein SARC_08390 [Sphaeroforma arctica JP610]|eukprot:XP_014153105.1 hypothetical protein SARC_08390 [Sphaeroforma arctica JP610]
MGKKQKAAAAKNKKKTAANHRKAEKKKLIASNEQYNNDTRNFVPSQAKGCHVACMDSKWIVGLDRFRSADFGDGDIPDISVDPTDGLLSFVNTSDNWRSYNISTGLTAISDGGDILEAGAYGSCTVSGNDARSSCTTFVAVLPPHTIMDVCYLEPNEYTREEEFDLQSDIKNLTDHPGKSDMGTDTDTPQEGTVEKESDGDNDMPASVFFPKPTTAATTNTATDSTCAPTGNDDEAKDFHAKQSSQSTHTDETSSASDVGKPQLSRPPQNVITISAGNQNIQVPVYAFPLGEGGFEEAYLCSQGINGAFTHYFSGTLHAIDLACAPGTPVRAVADGEVMSIQQANTEGGIHISLLYKWNSMMLKLDDGRFVEYVHTQTDSARVAVGDRVTEGDILCLSGSVGFCPSPHLHIQVHQSDASNADTIMFALKGQGGKPFVPVAGNYYNSYGLTQKALQ